MCEDNKNPENGIENNGEAEILAQELENLRDTFQEKLDESVKEAENEPAIQELEYGEEMLEEHEAEDEEAVSENGGKKKKQKKGKTGKKIAIAVPIVLLVCVVCLLLTYVVASITNPNFSSFVSSYVQAGSAEEYDDKIDYLEKAASYCSDEDSAIWKAMKRVVLEDIVVEMYKEKGYEEAYSYITENMSGEVLSTSSNREFKKIIAIKNSVNDFSLNLVDKVIKNVGESAETPADEVLFNGITVPEAIKETGEGVVKTIAEGFIYNRSAEDVKDSLTSVTSFYASVYNALVSNGADSTELAQNIAMNLDDNGYMFEAAAFSYLYVKEDAELSDEYKAFHSEIAKFADFDIDVIELAQTAVAENKTSDEEILAAVKAAVETDESKTELLAQLVKSSVVAVNAENGHNFSEASDSYSAVLSAQSVLGMDDSVSYLRICQLLVTSGDISSLQSVFEEYFTDETVNAFSESDKAIYDDIKALLDDFTAVYNVYAEKMQSTADDVTFDTTKAALEALITDDASNYTKGFVNYFIYGAAISFDTDVSVYPYLDKVAEYLPDMPFLYGGIYIDEYIGDKNYTAAAEWANKLLEIDVSYEYANYVAAFCKRVEGDIDAAIAAALVGIDVADSKSGCGMEAAIDYLLKGDFETAYNYLSMAYTANSPSIELYDLILIFDALYDGDNEDIKSELESMVSVVEQTYTYNGVSSYADTEAVISGEKTLKDVFAGGNYLLSDD